MDRLIEMDIVTGQNCRLCRLLTWTSFVSQLVYSVEEEWMG